MTSKAFEIELQAIDPRLTVVPNPNRPGISNIKLNGRDVCPIPDELRDMPDPTYVYTFPNGYVCAHMSKTEALAHVNTLLEKIKDKEFHDAFFGLGEYK